MPLTAQREYHTREESAADRRLRHVAGRDEQIADAREHAASLVTGAEAADWCAEHYLLRRRDAWRKIRYLTSIMEVFSRKPEDRPRVGALWKGSQLGFSEAMCAYAGWRVGEQQERCVVAMPNDGEANKWHRRFARPMLEYVPVLKALCRAREDQRGGLGRHVEFHTGAQMLVQGAKTADRYASFVAEFLLLDELDRYEVLAEGNPMALSLRPIKATNGVLLAGSTPTSAHGPSQIVEQYRKSEAKFTYAVKCPCCKQYDALVWEQMQWDETGTATERAETVRHECGKCGKPWRWERLREAVQGGRWQEAEIDDADQFPRLKEGGLHIGPGGALKRGRKRERWPETAGFALWSGYSTWDSWTWATMVSQWLEAQGSTTKTRVFVEQNLARVWFDADSFATVGDLEKHSFESLDDIPDEARLGVCSVDVQQSGWLSALLTVWDQKGNVWIADRAEFMGEVERMDGSAWNLFKQWFESSPLIAGRRQHLLAIDAGFHPDIVVANLRRIGHRHGYAVLGRAGWERPLAAVSHSKVKGKVRRTYLVAGTDNAKSEMVAGMTSGRVRVLRDLIPTIGKELVAETVGERVVLGRKHRYWRQDYERNEALDCLVYALSAWTMAKVRNIAKLPLGKPEETPPAEKPRKRRRIRVRL